MGKRPCSFIVAPAPCHDPAEQIISSRHKVTWGGARLEPLRRRQLRKRLYPTNINASFDLCGLPRARKEEKRRLQLSPWPLAKHSQSLTILAVKRKGDDSRNRPHNRKGNDATGDNADEDAGDDTDAQDMSANDEIRSKGKNSNNSNNSNNNKGAPSAKYQASKNTSNPNVEKIRKSQQANNNKKAGKVPPIETDSKIVKASQGSAASPDTSDSSPKGIKSKSSGDKSLKPHRQSKDSNANTGTNDKESLELDQEIASSASAGHSKSQSSNAGQEGPWPSEQESSEFIPPSDRHLMRRVRLDISQILAGVDSLLLYQNVVQDPAISKAVDILRLLAGMEPFGLFDDPPSSLDKEALSREAASLSMEVFDSESDEELMTGEDDEDMNSDDDLNDEEFNEDDEDEDNAVLDDENEIGEENISVIDNDGSLEVEEIFRRQQLNAVAMEYANNKASVMDQPRISLNRRRAAVEDLNDMDNDDSEGDDEGIQATVDERVDLSIIELFGIYFKAVLAARAPSWRHHVAQAVLLDENPFSIECQTHPERVEEALRSFGQAQSANSAATEDKYMYLVQAVAQDMPKLERLIELSPRKMSFWIFVLTEYQSPLQDESWPETTLVNPFTSTLLDAGKKSLLVPRGTRMVPSGDSDPFFAQRGLGLIPGLALVESSPPLPQAKQLAEDVILPLQVPWNERLVPLANYYMRNGSGVLARGTVFRWNPEERELFHIPDAEHFPILQGLEEQQTQLSRNLQFLMLGLSAQHTLIIGPKGMGKSALLRSTLFEVNATHDEACIKLIEVQSLYDLTDLRAFMGNSAPILERGAIKFIVCVEELDLDDYDEVRSVLNVLDGGLSSLPSNTIVVAMSRESPNTSGGFLRANLYGGNSISDYDSSSESSASAGGGAGGGMMPIGGYELAGEDEDMMALKERFALQIRIPPPTQESYIAAVKAFSSYLGISIPDDILTLRATRFARERSSNSMRVARQFAEFLYSEQALFKSNKLEKSSSGASAIKNAKNAESSRSRTSTTTANDPSIRKDATADSSPQEEKIKVEYHSSSEGSEDDAERDIRLAELSLDDLLLDDDQETK